MLIWVAALHCEAKPIIDFYRLKKSPRQNAFDLYQKPDMQCVISGIGKIASAAATAWVAALNHQQSSICWINLGTAGAASAPVGEIYWLNKITDSQSNRSYSPVPTFTIELQSKSCISLDQSSTNYHSNAIYDMEASAFFATASRFSTAEMVHSLKVISDNQQYQTGYDKPAVSKLIQKQLAVINGFVENLRVHNKQLINDE